MMRMGIIGTSRRGWGELGRGLGSDGGPDSDGGLSSDGGLGSDGGRIRAGGRIRTGAGFGRGWRHAEVSGAMLKLLAFVFPLGWTPSRSRSRPR